MHYMWLPVALQSHFVAFMLMTSLSYCTAAGLSPTRLPQCFFLRRLPVYSRARNLILKLSVECSR